jgi:hydrogenase nickel incorporation protein HypA/HybF
MHEVSIMQALFKQLEELCRRHRATRVVSAAVEVGELSNVVPELLVQAFEAFRTVEPLLEEARLEIRPVPLAAACKECGSGFPPMKSGFRCPQCSSTKVEVTQGEDLILRDVELEIPEAVHG